MPVTPKFSISQTDEFVVVKIRVPFVKISSTEIAIEDCDFTFYCKPYLLKLKLPYGVIDDDRCKATYDIDDDNGTILCNLPKATSGQYFPDLDLSTKLMALRIAEDRREMAHIVPCIEVLSSCESQEIEESSEANSNSGIDSSLKLFARETYGFNSKYSRVFGSLREIFSDLLELPEPDSTPCAMRRALRVEREAALFDQERYIGDLFGADEDYVYTEAMLVRPHWEKQWTAWTGGVTAEGSFDISGGFIESECEAMQVRSCY